MNAAAVPASARDVADARHDRHFRWSHANGSAQAQALDYVPLPAELVQQVEAYWAAQLK